MSLRSINFNLVPVLRILLKEQSVSKAAGELGLTQSAVSAALARMRIAFDDPLLVRVGTRMQLTERARSLIQPVEQLCRDMGKLLEPPAFDPATLQRDFTIGTADWVALHIVARLTPLLKIRAPHVSIRCVEGAIDQPGRLSDSQVDMVVIPAAALSKLPFAGLMTEALFRDDYVMVVARDHPLASYRTLTAEDCAPYRHIIYHYGMQPWNESSQHEIAGKPLRAHVSVRIQQLSLMPVLALETGDVTMTPRSVAERMARWLPLCILETPETKVELDMHMAWSAVQNADEGHAWFRRTLAESLREGPSA